MWCCNININKHPALQGIQIIAQLSKSKYCNHKKSDTTKASTFTTEKTAITSIMIKFVVTWEINVAVINKSWIIYVIHLSMFVLDPI